MITREEAKAKIWDNKSINTLSKVESSKVIDELFDQFESQLSSNPLQLTCDLELKSIKLIKILDELICIYPNEVYSLCVKHNYYTPKDIK